MIVYLIRHGSDDTTKRGGWSNQPLTKEGVEQSEHLAQTLIEQKCEAVKIISSDLPRAKQTAEVLARYLHLKAKFSPDFREVNNGILAGMDNTDAERQYPGLYWKNLAWEQSYPGGESPKCLGKLAHRQYKQLDSCDSWRCNQRYSPFAEQCSLFKQKCRFPNRSGSVR